MIEQLGHDGLGLVEDLIMPIGQHLSQLGGDGLWLEV
jgi:hypothetical protein